MVDPVMRCDVPKVSQHHTRREGGGDFGCGDIRAGMVTNARKTSMLNQVGVPTRAIGHYDAHHADP